MTIEKHTKNQGNSELEQLQYLLFGEESSRLNRLDQRISDFKRRVRDVSEVLPSAFQRVTVDPVLESEIEEPMMRTIRASIKRDAHAFAEYLFPVMGPAIRRAVADALKSLVQRINVAMEHNFTAKGLRWRLEAARSGVPFTQVVLRHTMLYTVQEAFLIARETGLMLSHAHRDEHLVLDEDAVAAMLTAIQAFIQDSLGMSADDPLRSAELGDRSLWIINGPSALLACVIVGTPPRSVREDLTILLETIHARYGERFIENNKSLAEDTGLRLLVQHALREEVDDQSESDPRSKAPIYWAIAIALLLLFSGWNVWHGYQQRELKSQVVESFRNQPGYLVSGVRNLGDDLIIEGLRDPGSPQPSAVLAGKKLPDQNLKLQFKPFWSLEPVLVLQRLRTSMQLADSISLDLKQGILKVEGLLSHQQTTRLQALTGIHPLIESVDLTHARLSAIDAIKLAREQLGAADSVLFTVDNGDIKLSGTSDIDWYLEASAVPRLIGGWKIGFEPLRASLQKQLRADIADLDGTVVLFSKQNRLTLESNAAIDSFSQELHSLLRSAVSLDIPLTVTLVGEADGTGTAEQNARVSRGRVQLVKDRLVSSGVAADRLRTEYPAWQPGEKNLEQRRVVIRVVENQNP